MSFTMLFPLPEIALFGKGLYIFQGPTDYHLFEKTSFWGVEVPQTMLLPRLLLV